ncbi:GNAT domain-containing protein [Aspergillus multicolor]|uniref:GNAT family N-acetyltransferase n=1 Tax=Aspergillus multicolor TaxID=41759 RepID=UPI003CCE0D95
MAPQTKPNAQDTPVSVSNPTLGFQTTRLSFKPLRLSDTVALHELRTEPEVMKWSVQKGPDADLKQTEDWVKRSIGLDDANSSSSSHPEGSGSTIAITRSKSKKKGLVFSVRELSYLNSQDVEGQAEKEDRIIAVVGIKESESPVSGKMQYELGYMFVPGVWGKGYASEAVKGILGWWFEYLGSFDTSIAMSGATSASGVVDGGEGDIEDKDGVYAIVAKTNGASIRVMEKCGLRVVGQNQDADDRGLELVEFCISKSDLVS